ncbi:MAG: DUF4118 domain-containing protein [Acidimicrobiia bacterium]
MSETREGGTRPVQIKWWPIAFAIVTPVAVALALLPFREHIRTANASLVLVVVVLLAAVFGGRTGGAVAAVVSAMSFVFFFTQPYNSLTVDSADDVETTVLLLIVGLAVGEIVLRSHRHRRAVEERTAEIGKMRRFAELAAGNEPAGRLINVVRDELTELLGLRRCRFERPPFTTRLPVLQHGRVLIPGSGDETAWNEIGHEVELPVYGEGREVARFVLEMSARGTGVAIPPEDRALAVALADQLGAVLVAGEHSPD